MAVTAVYEQAGGRHEMAGCILRVAQTVWAAKWLLHSTPKSTPGSSNVCVRVVSRGGPFPMRLSRFPFEGMVVFDSKH